MPLRQRLKPLQRFSIHNSAIFFYASEQRFTRSTETSAAPTGVLIAALAVSTLQDPLQRIINHSPAGIKHYREQI
jgi:hypothetical protein